MSLKPFDSADLPGVTEAVAATAIQAAGMSTPVQQAATAAVHTVSALQASTDVGAALATGAIQAAQANPTLAKAMHLADIANKPLNNVPNLSASAVPTALSSFAENRLPDMAVPSSAAPMIEEHPLAGQAVRDFATKEPLFLPKAAAAKEGNAATHITAALAAGIPNFDDSNRLLRFYAPLPEDTQLLIESLNGHAEISEPFSFSLTLISSNASIDLKDVLGKNVSVGIQQADGSEDYINGYVSSFSFLNADGGFAFYQAEVVPWLEYLTRRINCRIFQNKNVKEVLEEIFDGDYYGLADYEFRIRQTYPPENYIVQYNESDENFVCRLMEKYGLFYYFSHSDAGHTLIISDDSPNAEFCPPHAYHPVVDFNSDNCAHSTDGITHLAAQRVLQPAKVALNTFDFKAPRNPQYVEMPTVAQQGDVPKLEVYDGNPAFNYKNISDGAREAKQRMEVLEWQTKIFSGASDCRALIPGHSFILRGHRWFDPYDKEDADFLVLSVTYRARNNYFDQNGSAVYSNTFTCIRRKIPYRPRLQHLRPQMPGPQTATVVGPKGTEIHTDKYGRIKVQFHWDRYGRHDERSSCWIRVSQPLAGKGWGTVSIPRVGQEVIIDYLEGNPDRPVCTGRLYNAEQPAPYALPDGAHMMGFKSRSTPGGGGFCEMVIHDKKGQEMINIHSQKDMVTTVQNTQATIVNGPHQTNTLTNGFHITTVKKHIGIESQTEHVHVKAATSITLEVGASKIHMDVNGTIKIEGVHVDVVGSGRIDLNK